MHKNVEHMMKKMDNVPIHQMSINSCNLLPKQNVSWYPMSFGYYPFKGLIQLTYDMPSFHVIESPK